MCTKFSGQGLSGFGDFVHFCFASNFPFGPWGQKIENIHVSSVRQGVLVRQVWWLTAP